MLLSRQQRLPSQLVCLLFATAAKATITQSNSSTAFGDFQGTLALRRDNPGQTQLADLVPLTLEATKITVTGNLYNTVYDNRDDIKARDIAYISCNPANYPGFADAQRVFEDVYGAQNISGVILYSTVTDYCSYEQPNSQQMLQDFPVFSMTDKQMSAALLDAIDNATSETKSQVIIQGRADGNTTTGGTYNQPNPLGPSPSTAVAMIILYSITGIITALFLVIIITGAIRAHRHPERYGPRNVLGRPRQSRARGLGRAILDTIPIVKFGEKEPGKPADVELASTAESRGPNDATGITNHDATTGATEAANTADTTRGVPVVPAAEEHQEGIAPAQPVMAAASNGKDSASQDENLGCSICTEDFEMGQDLRVLPCDHKFHPECVDPWLLNVSGTCPLCRVDLRPVTSRDSIDPDAESSDPLPAESSSSEQRHRGAFRDILSLRHRPNATPQERIYYLRRLREQRRNRSGDVAEPASEDPNERRRSKRMSARISGVFTGRRRERSPPHGESSRSGAQQPVATQMGNEAVPEGSSRTAQ